MELRSLGKTEMYVARIGFGGMTIPAVDVEQAVATVNRAIDLGVNFIDTARVYGNGDSERKVGRVMRHRRSEVYLSSRSPDVSYDGMKRAIDESLAALQTDFIDLYEAHDVSTETKYLKLMGKDGALKALQGAKEEGKIKHVGFTGHNWELLEKVVGSGAFEAVLITYNLVTREAEERIIDLAQEHDVGLFVMKVFGNSRLLRLKPPGEERSPTVEDCLRFALSNQALPLILTGVKSPEEIEQNVAIAENSKPLSAAEQRELREFGDKLGRGYCWGCNYCLPCPQGIPIPDILQLLDFRERVAWEWPQAGKAYRRFQVTIEQCVDCEQCEQRCPQHLPIRERLRKAHKMLTRTP